MTKVAIVILNYNGKSYLQNFLPTVLQHSAGHEVWIADNASSDHSLEWVIGQQLPVKILSFNTNDGYAGGYNRALKEIDADYYVLLNSDIEVTENWIEPIIALMESDPLIAACQPKICAYDLPTHFEYAGAAGGHLDYLGYPFCRGRIFDTREEDLGQYDDIAEVFWATGACMFVRASLFHRFGGFDEFFFAHMEEIDLCWRMKKENYRIMYCGHSKVYHVGGGTLHKSNPRKTFLNYRNNLLMLHKNLTGAERWRVIFIRLFLDGLSSVRYIASGAFLDVLAIVKAHFAFYLAVGRMKKGESRLSANVPLYDRSVVWEYFVRGRHTYRELKGFFSSGSVSK
jgi:GT2 family glycosyltransferase